MTAVNEQEERTPWQLARLADCSDPDSNESVGAQFLQRVESDVLERIEDGSWDEDASHEIADSAVPVYTFDIWRTFTDLGAWDQDVSELGAESEDMTKQAQTALYMIAAHLADVLAREIRDDD